MIVRVQVDCNHCLSTGLVEGLGVHDLPTAFLKQLKEAITDG